MQIGYVLDFSHELAERECYMNIKKGIEVQSDTEWLLKSRIIYMGNARQAEYGMNS